MKIGALVAERDELRAGVERLRAELALPDYAQQPAVQDAKEWIDALNVVKAERDELRAEVRALIGYISTTGEFTTWQMQDVQNWWDAQYGKSQGGG